MKKNLVLLGILAFLAFTLPAAAQELRLTLAPGVLERLSEEGSEFYIEWATYRNT